MEGGGHVIILSSFTLLHFLTFSAVLYLVYLELYNGLIKTGFKDLC